MVQFNEYLDRIFSEFSKVEYSSMMSKAKVLFMDFAGSFDEDNLDIEAKWSQFRDWFLFVYPGTQESTEMAPSQIMKGEKFQHAVDIAPDIMTSILESRLSVFQHLKSYKDQIKVRDLMTRNKHYVFDTNIQLILEKKDYFQARIYKFNDTYYLDGSFVVHPPSAKKYIDSKIKILKKERKKEHKTLTELQLLESLFKMYYRALRFKQVEVQKVYSDQPLFERKGIAP